MAESIREAMTSDPRSIDADQSVAYAARMMRDEDVGLAPIVQGEKLVGMLTDRDIVVRVISEGRDPESVKVGEVASRELVTIDAQQSFDEALNLMARHQIRRLPVVEENDRLVGVLAQSDIAQEGNQRETGELVEEISEQRGTMAARTSSTRKSSGTRSTARRSGSTKRSTAKRSTAKRRTTSVRTAGAKGGRATAKKRTTAKRSTAKRSTAKRSTAKRSTAKRSTAKRSTAKRSTAKRSTAKRSTAKRSTAKRSTAKRSTAKRSTAKRSTAKRRTSVRTAGAKGGRATARKRSTARSTRRSPKK